MQCIFRFSNPSLSEFYLTLASIIFSGHAFVGRLYCYPVWRGRPAASRQGQTIGSLSLSLHPARRAHCLFDTPQHHHLAPSPSLPTHHHHHQAGGKDKGTARHQRQDIALSQQELQAATKGRMSEGRMLLIKVCSSRMVSYHFLTKLGIDYSLSIWIVGLDNSTSRQGSKQLEQVELWDYQKTTSHLGVPDSETAQGPVQGQVGRTTS
jgi:hypothetical protein